MEFDIADQAPYGRIFILSHARLDEVCDVVGFLTCLNQLDEEDCLLIFLAEEFWVVLVVPDSIVEMLAFILQKKLILMKIS